VDGRVLLGLLLAAVALAVAGGIFVLTRLRGGRQSSGAAATSTEPTGVEPQAEQDVFDLATSGVLALAGTIPGVRLATQVARAGVEVRRAGLAPTLAESLRRIADYAESDRPTLGRSIAKDGSVVLMFSDIEGSTALNERLGDAAWLELLAAHDNVVRKEVRRCHGQVVKTQGDSFMVVFRDLAEAVDCAVSIQRRLAEHPPGDTTIRVRMGIHRGEVTKQGRDVFGINVALAARVASQARGGEILVSAEVARHRAELASVKVGPRRRARLKGLSQQVDLYPLLF
jgi:class 3 adenylate cyclase